MFSLSTRGKSRRKLFGVVLTNSLKIDIFIVCVPLDESVVLCVCLQEEEVEVQKFSQWFKDKTGVSSLR